MIVRFSGQKILAFTIAYIASFLGLLNCINAILNVVGFNTTMDTVLLYALTWFLVGFVYIYIPFRYKLKIDIFSVIIIFILLFIVTPFVFPDNKEYIFSSSYTYSNNPILVLLVYSFVGYVAFRYLEDYECLISYLRCFSYVIVILSAVVYFSIKESFANQYMTLSYNMLLQVCMLFCFPPKKNLFLHYVVLVVGIFIVTVGGARGALVGLLVGILIDILLSNKKSKVTVIALCIVLLIVFLFYQQIIMMMVVLLEGMGISSRNLTLFLSNSGDITSGRFVMFTRIFEKLSVFGQGIYGDRVVLGGTYAHNLFLEWIAQFGIIGGILLSASFIAMLVFAFKNSKGIIRKLMIVLIPNGIIGLMFSGSYLNYQPAFYMLWGLCINVWISMQKKLKVVQYDGA